MAIKKENSMQQRIGIMSAERGVGVTHLAIMLGNYINARWNKDTAILEMNHNTQAFSQLQESYVNQLEKDKDMTSFLLSHITYYYNIEKQGLGKIYSQSHECIIMDFGEISREKTEEFLKCHIKIFMGNFTPWNKQKIVDCIENFIVHDYKEQIKYVTRFGFYDDVKWAKKAYKINISLEPFEPDPFLVHGKHFEFLEKLLS